MPTVVAELNGQQVKVVRFEGAYVWHHHDVLFEPASTRNTGNVDHAYTVDAKDLPRA